MSRRRIKPKKELAAKNSELMSPALKQKITHESPIQKPRPKKKKKVFFHGEYQEMVLWPGVAKKWCDPQLVCISGYFHSLPLIFF